MQTFITQISKVIQSCNMEKNLDKIKSWAEDIAGQWNGDEPGGAEDRAHQANDILEAIKNLEELVEGMDNL